MQSIDALVLCVFPSTGCRGQFEDDSGLDNAPLETSRFREINATRCGHSSSCRSLEFAVYMM